MLHWAFCALVAGFREGQRFRVSPNSYVTIIPMILCASCCQCMVANPRVFAVSFILHSARGLRLPPFSWRVSSNVLSLAMVLGFTCLYVRSPTVKPGHQTVNCRGKEEETYTWLIPFSSFLFKAIHPCAVKAKARTTTCRGGADGGVSGSVPKPLGRSAPVTVWHFERFERIS